MIFIRYGGLSLAIVHNRGIGTVYCFGGSVSVTLGYPSVW